MASHQPQTILVQDGQQFRLTTNITVFFDCKGIVCNEFLPRDETINRFRCIEILRHLSHFPQPPYSSDLAFFSKMKRLIKKGSIDDFKTIKKRITERTEEHFGRRLLERLAAVEATLGKVYYRPNRVL